MEEVDDMARTPRCRKVMVDAAILFIIMWILSPAACAVTYADPNGRYEIWYPDGWEILYQPGTDIVFRDNIHDDFLESINVVVDHTDRVYNRESYVLDVAENTIDGMMEDNSGTTVHSEPHTYMIDGHWAVTYILDVDYQFITARQAQTIIASEGYSIIFAITCSSTPSDYSSYSATFDRSVQSFNIVDEPENELSFW